MYKLFSSKFFVWGLGLFFLIAIILPDNESELSSSSNQTNNESSVVNEEEEVKSNETVSTENKESNTETNNAEDNLIKATVIKHTDGDTFAVNLNNKEEKVRLVLVDTPETVHPTKPEQPFGKEASEYTKNFIEGKEVSLEFDAQERDRYGRLLAYVYVDGIMLNQALLENGLARVAVYPPNTKYLDEFKEIEVYAKNEGLGIWSIENYATDGGYEEEVYEQESEVNEDSSNETVSQDCNIKGNINSKGEMIYHVPSGQFYDRTDPEEMFCSEEEAEAAGYRASKR